MIRRRFGCFGAARGSLTEIYHGVLTAAGTTRSNAPSSSDFVAPALSFSYDVETVAFKDETGAHDGSPGFNPTLAPVPIKKRLYRKTK